MFQVLVSVFQIHTSGQETPERVNQYTKRKKKGQPLMTGLCESFVCSIAKHFSVLLNTDAILSIKAMATDTNKGLQKPPGFDLNTLIHKRYKVQFLHESADQEITTGRSVVGEE